jgi:hypothetical protein
MTTLDHYDRALAQCAADIPRWRALNRAAAELREGAIVYQPYAAANKALVKAAYNTLQEEHSYADYAHPHPRRGAAAIRIRRDHT